MDFAGRLIIGQYVPGTSVVHRLDPRAKLAIVMSFAASLFLVDRLSGFAWLAVGVALGVKGAGLPLRYVLRGIRPVVWLLGFTLLFHVFATPGDPLFQAGPLTATEQGVSRALFYGFRLLLLVAGSALLTLTTAPVSLTDGVEGLLGPFRKMGVPVHEMAMMTSIAIRFIPTIVEEAERLWKAHTARGVDFRSGGPIRRVRKLAPLLIPLFVSAFRRADELALAMEARGYRGGDGRGKLHPLRFQWTDAAALVVAAGATIWVAWLF